MLPASRKPSRRACGVRRAACGVWGVACDPCLRHRLLTLAPRRECSGCRACSCYVARVRVVVADADNYTHACNITTTLTATTDADNHTDASNVTTTQWRVAGGGDWSMRLMRGLSKRLLQAPVQPASHASGMQATGKLCTPHG